MTDSDESFPKETDWRDNTYYLEKIPYPHVLGNYLLEVRETVYVLLRGKYAGKPLQAAPRGYIREGCLPLWLDDLTDRERSILEVYARKNKEPP